MARAQDQTGPSTTRSGGPLRARRAGLRGAFAVLVAVAGCGEPPRPAPPPAPLIPPARPAATRCAYGLLGPEVSLTSDVARLHDSSVAWAAGRLLVVHHDDGIVARVYEPGAGLPVTTGPRAAPNPSAPSGSFSAPLRVSPTGIVPQVLGVGDRFLVTWQDRAGASGVWARWISATGEMSPERKLPVDAALNRLSLTAAAGGGVSVVWEDGSRLRRVVLGADLAVAGPAVELFAGDFLGSDVTEAMAPSGGTWLAFSASEGPGARERIRLLRLDGGGRPVGPPVEASSGPVGSVGSPALSVTPDGGVLVAWNFNRPEDERHLNLAGAWVRRFDAQGKPLEEPRQLTWARDLGEVGSSGSHDGVQLFRAPEGPVLVWGRHAAAMALSWDGTPAGPPAAMAPLAQRASGREQRWIGTDREPWVVFTDARHGRIERFAARVGCGGAAPSPASSVPLVQRRGDAPPPAVPASKAMSCPRFAVDLDLDAGPAVDFMARHDAPAWMRPRLVESEGALLIAWTNMAQAKGARRDAPFIQWRRLPLGGGRFADPSPQRGPDAQTFDLARGGGVLAGGPDEKDPLRLTSLAAGDGGRTISDPLVPAQQPVAVVSGGELGALWVQGGEESSFVEFRSLGSGKGEPGPTLPLSFPATGAWDPHAAAAPGGFVAVWRHGSPPSAGDPRHHPLRVARIAGGRGLWSAETEAIDAWSYDPVVALGVLGGQIYVVRRLLGHDQEKLPEVSALRWDLDGARLDDVPIDTSGMFLGAALSEAGITALTWEATDPPTRCVHRIGPDGKPTGPVACMPTWPQEHYDSLLWVGDALYHAALSPGMKPLTEAQRRAGKRLPGSPSREMHVRLRRFRCKP